MGLGQCSHPLELHFAAPLEVRCGHLTCFHIPDEALLAGAHFLSLCRGNRHVSKDGCVTSLAQNENGRDQRPWQEYEINLCCFKL